MRILNKHTKSTRKHMDGGRKRGKIRAFVLLLTSTFFFGTILSAGNLTGMQQVFAAEEEALTDGSFEPQDTQEQQEPQDQQYQQDQQVQQEPQDQQEQQEQQGKQEPQEAQDQADSARFNREPELTLTDGSVFAVFSAENTSDIRVSLYRKAEGPEDAPQDVARYADETALDEQVLSFDETGIARFEIPAMALDDGEYVLIAKTEDASGSEAAQDGTGGQEDVAMLLFEVVSVQAEAPGTGADSGTLPMTVTVTESVTVVSVLREADGAEEESTENTGEEDADDAGEGTGEEDAEGSGEGTGEEDAEDPDNTDAENMEENEDAGAADEDAENADAQNADKEDADAEKADAEIADTDNADATGTEEEELLTEEEGELVTEEALDLLYIPDASDITLNSGSPLSMFKGQTTQIRVDFAPAVQDTRLKWSSSDTKVATVDAAGNVTAKKAGTVFITATSVVNSVANQTVTVDVKDGLKTLKLDKTKVTVNANATPSFELTLTADAKMPYPNRHFDVVSSNPAVVSPYGPSASVDVNGRLDKYPIYVHSAGTAQITFTHQTTGRQIVCSVMADGVNISSTYPYDLLSAFKGGEQLSGWIYWSSTSKNFSTKAKADLVYYINPVDMKTVKGITKIGNNLYHFDKYSGQLTLGVKYLLGNDSDSGDMICYAKAGDGSLATGWHHDCYFDPVTGKIATDAWVPLKGGFTRVKTDGIIFNDYKGYQDSDNKRYYFDINSKVLTGWFYADSFGNFVTTRSRAFEDCWFYSDPVTGAMKGVPNNEFFMIGGKEYYAEHNSTKRIPPWSKDTSDDYEVGIVVRNRWCLGLSDKTQDFYAGADGAIIKNKTMKIGNAIYRFDADGHPVKGTVVEGGKTIDYDPNAWDGYGGVGGYIAHADNTGTQNAYQACDAKNGLRFYDTSGDLLKNEWIRTTSNASDPAAGYYYVDKNGRPVRGFQTIGGKRYYFDEATGQLVMAKKNLYGNYEMQIVKGKPYYIVDDVFPGMVLSGAAGTYDEKGVYAMTGFTYYVDANGMCVSGFRTINGNKYCFGPDGRLMKGWISVNGKPYFTDPAQGNLITGSPQLHVESGKAVFFRQADGSLRTGWIYTDASGNLTSKAGAAKWYYAGPNGYILHYNNNWLWRIDGKFYALRPDNSILTGWRGFKAINSSTPFHIRDAKAGDYLFTSTDESQWYDFYFDPKTGAAVSGLVTAPVPLPNYPNLWHRDNPDGNGGNNVWLCGENGSEYRAPEPLYFNPAATAALPACALMKNTDVTVKGKRVSLEAYGGIQKPVSEDYLWKSFDGKDYYRQSNGHMALGRTKVEDVWFYFHPVKGELVNNAVRKTGSKWYQYGANGSQEQPADPWDDLTNGSTGTVIAVYAADGSIKKFTYKNGVTAASITIKKGDQILALNASGLPLTGIVKASVNHAPKIYYFDKDGSQYVPEGSTTGVHLLKVNGKFLAYDATNKEVVAGAMAPVKEFRTLSAADQKQLGVYLSVSLNPGELMVYAGPDGYLMTNRETGKYRTNRYGVIMSDNLLATGFYRFGGKWYVNPGWIGDAAVRAGGEKDLNDFKIWQADGSGKPMDAVLRWNRGGQITGIFEKKTGKAISAYCTFMGYSGNYRDYYLKNGLPQTGKKTIKINGLSRQLTIRISAFNNSSRQNYCRPDKTKHMNTWGRFCCCQR